MKKLLGLGIGAALVLLLALPATAKDSAKEAKAEKKKDKVSSEASEGKGRKGPRHGHPGQEHMRRLRGADKDGDHKISADEFKAAFPEAPAERFKALDKNSDGFLTAEERPGGGRGGQGHRMMGILRKADKDEDKKVTKKEFKAAFPEAPAEHFKALDKNKDGVLSAADAPPEGRHGAGPRMNPDMLKRADKNKDGQVSFEEMTAARPNFPKEVFKRLDKNNDGVLSKKDGPPPERRKPAPNAEERKERIRARMKEADKDGDKKISLEEAMEALPQMSEERFKKMDRNSDGYLSPEDRK